MHYSFKTSFNMASHIFGTWFPSGDVTRCTLCNGNDYLILLVLTDVPSALKSQGGIHHCKLIISAQFLPRRWPLTAVISPWRLIAFCVMFECHPWGFQACTRLFSLLFSSPKMRLFVFLSSVIICARKWHDHVSYGETQGWPLHLSVLQSYDLPTDAPGYGHMGKISVQIPSMWEDHMSSLKTTQTSLCKACILEDQLWDPDSQRWTIVQSSSCSEFSLPHATCMKCLHMSFTADSLDHMVCLLCWPVVDDSLLHFVARHLPWGIFRWPLHYILSL